MYAVLLSFFSGKNVSSSCCCSGFCSSLKSCRRSLLVEDDANEKEEDKEAFRNKQRDSPKALLCPRLIHEDDNINLFFLSFFEENVDFFSLLASSLFSQKRTTNSTIMADDSNSFLQPRMKTE
jgi:hypothetical protein